MKDPVERAWLCHEYGASKSQGRLTSRAMYEWLGEGTGLTQCEGHPEIETCFFLHVRRRHCFHKITSQDEYRCRTRSFSSQEV